MKTLRKIIKIDEELCDGCGQCVPDCAEGSLKIVNGKAKLVADNLCDGLGACLGSCPTGALQIVEREAEEFDEDAVEAYLASEQQREKQSPTKGASDTDHKGCPSARLQSFPQSASSACQTANLPTQQAAGDGQSLLQHWPVQIRLIPAHAPFLQNSDLLVAADCTAVAAANFQGSYLRGKTVMMGCPKFDDGADYVRRFSEIFENCNLNSLTILIMEVPCCSAMKVIVKKALDQAGVTLPVEEIVISTRGEELSRTTW